MNNKKTLILTEVRIQIRIFYSPAKIRGDKNNSKRRSRVVPCSACFNFPKYYPLQVHNCDSLKTNTNGPLGQRNSCELDWHGYIPSSDIRTFQFFDGEGEEIYFVVEIS